MASIYTDAEREHRYAQLRKKKKYINLSLDICMWAALGTGAISILPNAFSSILQGMFLFDLGQFAYTLGALALLAFAVYAIYARKWKITLAAVIVTAITIALGSPIILILLIAALIADYFWHQLEQEEGFPLFDISFHEQQERQRKQEMISRHRALEAGTRAEHSGNPDNMSDILDSGGNTPVSLAHLQSYHDHLVHAELSTPGTESMPQYQRGVMDALEDIGAPAQPVQKVSLEKNTQPDSENQS